MAEIIFKFFRSVEGKVVPRYGTATFIGVLRDNKQGWVWDTATVVRVPEYEVTRYMREYRRALADGALVECSSADYDAQQTEATDEPTEVVRRRSNKSEKE